MIKRKAKKKMCKVEWCDLEVYRNKMYCHRHFGQIRDHGMIFKRTICDKNKFIKKNDYVIMFLYNQSGKIVNKTKIDIKNVNLIKPNKWYLNKLNYVTNSKIGSLHRFIMNAKKGQIVDHINRNKLDNRKQNLRFVNHSLNVMNSNLKRNNKTGTTGVCCMNNKYVAYMNHKILGYFNNKNDAIKVRKKEELKILGYNL